MENPISLLLLFLFLVISYTHAQSSEKGFISVDISNKGLDFVKDLLIEKAENSLVPLELHQIEKSKKIPVVGNVHMVLSNITIDEVHVISSEVKPGDGGIVIAISGATANLSLNWKYSYSTWLIPISVSDKGEASVQVGGMEIGLTLSLENQEGSLKMSLLECGCHVKDISIKLDGGASWLYQGLVDAFQGRIISAVEDAIPKKIRDGILKLDSVLQSLPTEVPITTLAALNVTVIGDPVLSDSSLALQINGLFNARNQISLQNYFEFSKASLSCKFSDKMFRILLHEELIKSASLIYFEADKMHWVVDKVPDQSLLNTAGWRFIVPELYKRYPNDDMNLNISVSLLPIIKVGKQLIDATVPSDVVIDVLDYGEVIPVACISVVITASIYPEILNNILTGSVKLNDFTMSLRWSKIGNPHMYLLQTFMSTLLKTVVLPYVNLQLRRGYLLPSFHSYELHNAQILCSDSWIVVCCDAAPVTSYNHSYSLF